MKRSGKNITGKGKGKNINNPNKSNFNNVIVSIKKLSSRISLSLILRCIIKTIFICFCSLVIICFFYLLARTRSPLCDIFTTGRIGILKDRPANITRDIIVDMANFGAKGGMMVLTRSLVTDIAKRRPDWRFLILISKKHEHVYNFPKYPNIKLIGIKCFPITLFFTEQIFNVNPCSFHDKLTQLLYHDLIFCDDNCDLVWDPLGDSSFCNFANVPRISTVHDLACFDVAPEFFASPSHRLGANMLIRDAMHFSKKIITVSEFSQKRICDKFRVSEDFVKHIPTQLGTRIYSENDPKKRANVMNKYELEPQKYFIFYSKWWRNKNHGALMKAFNKFAQKNSEIKLILVGDHQGEFQSRLIEKFSSDRIIIAGFVPDEELGILLKNALAFIHPSVYEGFGMPIIEAMANGVPVACSNVASLPEVAGSAALLFDPFDTNSITQALHRMADDLQLRKNLIKKGYEQAKKYSDRDAMVNEYIRVMEEVMEENDRKKRSKS